MLDLFLYFAVVLWFGCFAGWLRILTRYKIFFLSWMDCKLIYFIFYYGRHYSSTLLVLMSIEKCFAVYFPLKSKAVCTVRTAKWACGITGLMLLGYNSVYLSVMDSFFIQSSGRHICYTVHFSVILKAVDSVLYSFIPFALMFITNFAIAFKFARAKCTQNNLTESTEQALAKSATRGTAMVVTVSVTFLLLTAPTAVYNALFRVYSLGSLPLYVAYMNLTQYLNHSINGVLYCIVGSRFRNEMFKLICRNKRPQISSAISSVN